MGKFIARVVGVLLFIAPAISFALGLGPITMRSSLNQPLDAEIDIHSAQPGDLDGLAIRLASPEDFARVNVERSIFLTQIQFKLKFRSDGSAYIKLTTRQPVTEPYLDFLIEARWPRGRALKEYTVLVDPPVLTAETPKPVEQAGTSPVFSEPQRQQRRPVRQPRQPIRQAQPEPEQVSPPPLRREPPPVEREFEAEPEVASRDVEREQFTPSGDVDYGRVRKGDTLWEIARDTRPDNSITIQQMMLAYLRDNPDAFVDGNINKLKAGYVLRVEDASTISDTSQREAVSEVRRQNLAWRESRSTRTVRQTEETSDVASSEGLPDFDGREESSASTSTASADDPRLELVAPGTEDQGSGGAGAEEGGAKKEDLARASEALDAGRKESEELTSRSAELEEQLQSMQRLIQLKDEELLALQNQVAQGTVDQAIDEQKQLAAQQQQNKPKQQPKQPDMVEELLSDPVLLGLAGLLVVAVLGWLVMRRRRMHDGFEESILNVGAQADASGPMSAQPESAMVSDFVMSDMTGGGTDVSEVDAISEADVYLAYGRHQQAEDILRQAMEQSPDRLDLQAKLLEVFHAAKNADAFESEAQALHARIGGDETNTYWTDIVSLGRELCPNSPLFGGEGGAPAGGMDGVSEDEADLLDFDFDANAAAGGGDAGDSADDALDFDMSSLDFDMDTGDDSKADDALGGIDALDNAMESEADSSGAIDFDMSMGSDDSGTDTVLHEAPAADDSPIDLDMGSSDLDMGLDMDMDMGSSDDLSSSDDSLDMGLDFETSSSSDDGAIELSFDEGDSSIGVASSSDDDDMSLDFDQGADIVQLDTGGGDDIDLDGELDEDIFNNVDEVGTKLDLAKAYVDMGDSDGARSILDEVLEEGDDTQKQQAEELLQQMG